MSKEHIIVDEMILRTERLDGGRQGISLMPNVYGNGQQAIGVGDIVISGAGCWRVEEIQTSKYGLRLVVSMQ